MCCNLSAIRLYVPVYFCNLAVMPHAGKLATRLEVRATTIRAQVGEVFFRETQVFLKIADIFFHQLRQVRLLLCKDLLRSFKAFPRSYILHVVVQRRGLVVVEPSDRPKRGDHWADVELRKQARLASLPRQHVHSGARAAAAALR